MTPRNIPYEKVLEACGIPSPTREFRFMAGRRFAFDYAWPDKKVALEVEGGVYGHRRKDGSWSTKGAHSSVTGIKRDIEKYNAATLLGWRVFRVLPDAKSKSETIDMIRTALTR